MMSVFDPLKPLINVKILLTEEELLEINEYFDKYARPQLIINDEVFQAIRIKRFQDFLELKKYHRRNFHYPSYAEIMKDIEDLKATMITKDQFIYMLNKWVLLPNIKHEIKLAFNLFDTEKRDFLDIEEIRSIVTTYADVFNEEEVIELLRDINVRGDGNVFYNDFIESIFSVAPELYDIKVEYLYEDPDEDPSVEPEPVIEEPVIVEEPVEPPKKKGKGKGKK